MKSLRIKEDQSENLRQLAINANKKLVQLGREPLKDSEIAHALLNEAIKRAAVDEDGKLIIR